MRTAVAAAAMLAALAVGAGSAAAPAAKAVRSIAIVGANVSGTMVEVRVQVRGWRVDFAHEGSANRPGTGHWRIFVDGRYNNWSADPTRGLTRELAQGHHRIFVALAQNNGKLLRPRVRSRAVDVDITDPPPAGPMIGAAGDIACDPANPGLKSTHPDWCRDDGTADALSGPTRLAAVLPLGDEQYECGLLSSFRKVYSHSWGRYDTIARPVPGNHEYQTYGADHCIAGGVGYFEYFGSAAGPPGKGWYSYDLGSWHLIALNSNCDEIGSCGRNSEELTWLRADLAAHKNLCTLAYWHHPRWSSGTSHGSNPRFDAFWKPLYAAGVDVVLNGHEHNYERFMPQNPEGQPDPQRGIREFVVGTGGRDHGPFGQPLPTSEVRGENTYGVLKLTLRPDGYDWRFVPVRGFLFTDSGSASCH